ncbi:MAG: hypothetical protein Q7S00_04605 [bacterium]|nr:hypothetical protein [bacterium]
MATSLQEALLKSGLVNKEKLAKAKSQKKEGIVRRRGERPEPKKKSVGFLEGKHLHHVRTECELCKKAEPDVEYYEHNKKSLSVKWLCVNCADNQNILDDCRQTVQSEQAMRKMFRRRYGPTKVFK